MLKHLKLHITHKEKESLLNIFLILMKDYENDKILKERMTYSINYIKQ